MEHAVRTLSPKSLIRYAATSRAAYASTAIERRRIAALKRVLHRRLQRVKYVPIKQWNRNTGMYARVSRNANGRWVIRNKNATATRYGLQARRIVIRNVNRATPTVHHDEWTSSQVNSMPYLRFK